MSQKQILVDGNEEPKVTTSDNIQIDSLQFQHIKYKKSDDNLSNEKHVQNIQTGENQMGKIVANEKCLNSDVMNNIQNQEFVTSPQLDINEQNSHQPIIEEINDLNPQQTQDFNIDGPILSQTTKDQLELVIENIKTQVLQELSEANPITDRNDKMIKVTNDELELEQQDSLNKNQQFSDQKKRVPGELLHQPEFIDSNTSEISNDSPPERATSIEQHLLSRNDGNKRRKSYSHFNLEEEEEKEIDLNFKAKSAEERQMIEHQVQLALELQRQQDGRGYQIIKESENDMDKSGESDDHDYKKASDPQFQGIGQDQQSQSINTSTKDQIVQDNIPLFEQTKSSSTLNISPQSGCISNPQNNEPTMQEIEDIKIKEILNLKIQKEQEQIVQLQINMGRYKAIFEEGQLLKSKGNQSFQNKQHDQAINFYVDALSICHPIRLRDCPGELIDQFMNLNVQLLNNLAFCNFSIGEYDQCISFAQQTLQVDETNVKAQYRLALAYEKQQKVEDAWKYISLARKNDKKSQDIQIKHEELKALYQQFNLQNKKKEQELYQKMFSNTQDKTIIPEQTDIKEFKEEVITQQINITQDNQTEEVEKEDIQIKYAPLFTSKALVSFAVSTILATSATKFLLKENILTRVGLANSGIIGFGMFGALNTEKLWKRLAICTISSGIISLILFAKQKKQIN